MSFRYVLPSKTKETKKKPQNYIYSKKISEKSQQYCYHYTYYYEFVKQKENILAECKYDEDHLIRLTNKKMIISQENRFSKTYSLQHIQQIGIHFKRLMLPMILGGIFAPFSVLAFMTNLLELWIGIALFVVNMSLFYYGWKGTYQIHIKLITVEQHFFADSVSTQMIKLFEKANKLIKGRLPKN